MRVADQTTRDRPLRKAAACQVHTTIESWAAKTFVHWHRVRRGSELLCEGTEVRAFVMRDPADAVRLKAMPVPEDIKALCC